MFIDFMSTYKGWICKFQNLKYGPQNLNAKVEAMRRLVTHMRLYLMGLLCAQCKYGEIIIYLHEYL